MRLIYAAPSAGHLVPKIEKNHRMAQFYAANHGVKWAGDASPDRMGYAAARNATAEASVAMATRVEKNGEEPIDGVFWCDSDILMPQATILRLIDHGLDLVSGLYFGRTAPFLPVIGILNAAGTELDKVYQYPEDKVFPLDAERPGGFGFGCCFTSIKVLRAVIKLVEAAETQEEGPFGGLYNNTAFSEDYLFCLRASGLGFSPHVDTGIRLRHEMDPRYSDEKLYKRFRGALVA